MADIQSAMNSKDMVALGLAVKEMERLHPDEVRLADLLCLSYGLRCFCVLDVVVLIPSMTLSLVLGPVAHEQGLALGSFWVRNHIVALETPLFGTFVGSVSSDRC